MSSIVPQMQLICYEYIAPFFCWLGIITNILNLIVLTRRQMKGSAYSFLTSLAVTDMSTLLVFFLYIQVSSKAGHEGEMAYWWTLFNVYVVYIGSNMFCCASVWVISFITMDRYISVRWPLMAKFFCCRKYARRKILLAFILAIVFNSMRFCQYVVTSQRMNGTLITTVKPTTLRYTKYISASLWIYAVIVMYIPSVILIVANSYLLIHTRKANKDRMSMLPTCQRTVDNCHTKRNENRLSVTLIAITFFFLLCILPSAFSEPTIAFSIFGGRKTQISFFNSSPYRIYIIVSNLLVLMNCSINFFMYCAFNQKFSTTMKNLVLEFIRRLADSFQRRNSQTRRIISHIQLN